jgi:hypothetical protein
MNGLIVVPGLDQGDFPLGDISPETANTAAVLLAHAGLLEELHGRAEGMHPLFRTGHPYLEAAFQGPDRERQAIRVVMAGVVAYEALTVVTACQMPKDETVEGTLAVIRRTLEGEQHNNDIFDFATGAHGSTLSAAGNVCGVITEVVERVMGVDAGQAGYALYGAAAMNRFHQNALEGIPT